MTFATAPRFLALVLTLWVVRASSPEGPKAQSRPPCCRTVPAQKPLTDKSIYQLDSTWTSDVGRSIPLGVLRGRPQVVALFFTRCEYACPILVNEMQRLESALPSELRDRVDFLLLSFDTERDTPADLARYREDHHLAPIRWTLLTGRPDDVRELAALLGISYRKDGRGQFAHSNVITLLNAEGEITQQFSGLKIPVEEAAAALGKAVGTLASTPRS